MWKTHRPSRASVLRSSAAPDPTPAPGAVPPTPVPPPIPAPVQTPPRTRAGSTWVMACVAVVILIVLIVFIAQNSGPARISFFSLHGRFPLAVTLLAAVATGCVLTLAIGSTRILQLRRIVRRRHRDDLAATARAAEQSQTPDVTPDLPQASDPVHARPAGDRTDGDVTV